MEEKNESVSDINVDFEKAKESLNRRNSIIVGVGILVFFLIAILVISLNSRDEIGDNLDGEKPRDDSQVEYANVSQKYVAGEIGINLGNGRELFLTNPPSTYEEDYYRLEVDIQGLQIWGSNANGIATYNYNFYYYPTEQDLFGSKTIETVTIDGISYEYIRKEDGTEETGVGTGEVVNRKLALDINGYVAYETTTYYNPATSESTPSSGDFKGKNTNDSYVMKHFCLFDLNKIDSSLSGYLKFTEVSATEGIKTCEYFDEDFSIVLRDREVPQEEDCYSLDTVYPYRAELGEIRGDYVGSWHSGPSVGSGYNERVVLYPNGNFVYFPSEYESDDLGILNTEDIVQGTWGIKYDKEIRSYVLSLAKENDLSRVVKFDSIGSNPSRSSGGIPYLWEFNISDTTFWQYSVGADMWNPTDGDLCLF